MRRAVPKNVMASVTNRKILNPCWVCYSISFLQKAVDYRYMVYEWSLFPIACRMVSRDHYGPTSIGKTLVA